MDATIISKLPKSSTTSWMEFVRYTPDLEYVAEFDERPQWKELYHNYLSSYPLPGGETDYRDQYFYGLALVHYPYHYNPLSLLASVGYDKAFISMYAAYSKNATPEMLMTALKQAMLGGYTEIVEFLVPSVIPIESVKKIVDLSFSSGKLGVVKYLFTLMGFDGPQVAEMARRGVEIAAKAGHRDLMWSLWRLSGETQSFCTLRDYVLMSSNTSLFDYLQRRCGQPLPENYMDTIESVDMYYHLKPEGASIDRYTLLSAAATSCDLDALKQAYGMGVIIPTSLSRYISLNCAQPAIHHWMLENKVIPLDEITLVDIMMRYSEDIVEDYLNHLSKPVSGNKLLRLAVPNGVHLTRRILNHPHIVLTRDDIIRTLFIYASSNNSNPDIIRHLTHHLGVPGAHDKSLAQLMTAIASTYRMDAEGYFQLLRYTLINTPHGKPAVFDAFNPYIPAAQRPILAKMLMRINNEIPTMNRPEYNRIVTTLLKRL